LDGVERTPRSDYRTAITPSEHIGGRGLGVGRRVGKREDDRPRRPGGHLPYSGLREGSWLAASPDQNGRCDVADNGLKVVRVPRFETEFAHVLCGEGEGKLVVLNCLATFEEQTVRVEHGYRATGLVLGRALCEDSAADDPGRSLDVIVETRDPVPVVVEQSDGVVLLEVLPLQQSVGEDLL